MSNSTMLAFLLVAGVLTPGAALGQGGMELAMAGPQPHFVAAWAPKKEREAERSAVLAGRVSLELRDVSLDAALKVLTNQAGLRITYSRAMLPAGKRVTISARDVAVVTAMTELLFRSGLDVVVDRDGALALVVCRHPVGVAEVQDSGGIVGRVTDKATETAITGATVVVEGTGRSATTDGDGQYRIMELKAGTYTMRARYIGYVALTASVTVTAGEEVTVDFGMSRSVQKLHEVVTVTPGGMQREVKALPTPVSVISAAAIEQRRPQTLIDVIREAVPTAVVFSVPSRPDQTNFSVRGASSLSGLGAMKLFIDGVETAAFGSSPVDPASIERIEVLRGPQATTLYGADAATGVVQIFTKRGDPSLNRPEIGIEAALGIAQTPYDGFGGVLRQRYTGSVRGGSGDVGYNFGAGYTHLDDWLPAGELSRQSSPNVYGGIRYAQGIITADVHGRYFRNELPGGLNPLLMSTGFVPLSRPMYNDQDFTNETYGARFAVAPTGWWHNQLTLGLDHFAVANVQTQRRFTTPDDTLFQVFALSQRKGSLFYNSAVAGALSADIAGTLTVGIDHYQTEAHSFSTTQALNTTGTILTEPAGLLTESRAIITNTGYFAQAEVSWRDVVFLTAGARAEDNSTFGRDLGRPVLPRVGVSVVRPFGQTMVKLRGAYGRAIRAPEPGAAFGGTSSGQITLANPLLAPERQRGWDAGVDLVLGDRVSLSISGYDQTAEDLIVFAPLPSSGTPTAQFQNLGRVANSGLEVEATLQLTSFDLKAQYGYAQSRIEDLGPGVSPSADLQVGDRPLGLPRHTAGVTVTVRPRTGTSVTAGLTYVGSVRQLDALALIRCFGGTGPCPESFLATFSTRDFLIDYQDFTKLNAAITQRIARQLEGFVSVENLTNNTAYEGTNTIAVMGRITMAGMRASF